MRETDLQLPDGRTLHVYDTEGPGLPLLWHHGTPNLGAPPAPLLPAANQLGLRWFSFDRPGYGGSTPAPGRTVAAVARDAGTVADALGIDTFAVAGFSGGGTFALGTAAVHPDRVVAALSVAGIAPFTSEGLDWFAGMIPSGVTSLQAAAAGREALMAHETSGVEYDPEFTAADLALFDGPWGWLGSVAGEQAMPSGPDGLVDDDCSYVVPWGCDLPSAPTLLLHGERDRIIPSTHGRWLADHLPAAQLRLELADSHISILRHAESALPWIRAHA